MKLFYNKLYKVATCWNAVNLLQAFHSTMDLCCTTDPQQIEANGAWALPTSFVTHYNCLFDLLCSML